VLAGWISAEVGRQPYVVYGLLRTADAVSPVAGGQVAASLLVFMIVYAIVFTAGSLYILRLIAKGPGSGELPPERGHRAPGSLLASVTGDTEPGRAVP
jgi:cytochrome d ubiquinol oxidase subunit I